MDLALNAIDLCGINSFGASCLFKTCTNISMYFVLHVYAITYVLSMFVQVIFFLVYCHFMWLFSICYNKCISITTTIANNSFSYLCMRSKAEY